MKHFHNTTPVKGESLATYEKKAKSQDEEICAFMKDNEWEWTPSDLHLLYRFNKLPITSIRRALTNLTKAGKIEPVLNKDGEPKTRVGPYGRPERCWKFKQQTK